MLLEKWVVASVFQDVQRRDAAVEPCVEHPILPLEFIVTAFRAFLDWAWLFPRLGILSFFRKHDVLAGSAVPHRHLSAVIPSPGDGPVYADCVYPVKQNLPRLRG